MSFEQLLLLHLLPTVYMTGVIWFVQIVHYPLFEAVDRRSFEDFERRHSLRTSWVVMPPMLAELALAVLVVLQAPTEHAAIARLGAGLLGAVWLSTFVLQVPCHRQLADGYDERAWRRLVRSNWLRTIAWSLRTALAVALLW